MKTIIKASIVGVIAGVAAFAVCDIIKRRNMDYLDFDDDIFEEDFEDEINPIEIIDLDIENED